MFGGRTMKQKTPGLTLEPFDQDTFQRAVSYTHLTLPTT